jgi:hypothetical protein
LNPYTHLVIASRLEAGLSPHEPREYYWGAIAPDIRYLAGVPRQSTHLPSQKISAYAAQYPRLKSFLLGCLVHCLADEVDLRAVFTRHFPFSLFKHKLSLHHLAVLLELFHFENKKEVLPISGTYNQVLRHLGLSEAVCAGFARGIQQYTASTPADSRISALLGFMGLEDDPRIERYTAAARGFQNNPVLRKFLFMGIRAGRISDEIIAMVASSLLSESNR